MQDYIGVVTNYTNMKTTTKICSRCKTEKLKEDYNPRHWRDASKWCKPCCNAYSREWYAANPIIAKRNSVNSFNAYYVGTKGRATHMLNNAKQRSKRSGYEFDLDHKWIEGKLKIGLCEATGLPLLIEINGGKGHRNNSFSPSLERVDNSKGYTKNNVQVVCWIYNRAKGAFPIEDLFTMLKALEKRRSESMSL